MKFGYYILFSMVFFVVVFFSIYTITMERYDIGLGVSLPIALWATLIVVVFFLCTLCFLLFWWARSFIIHKRIINDIESIVEQILYQATQENQTFFTTNQNHPKDETINPLLPATSTMSAKRFFNAHLDMLAKIIARYYLSPNLSSQSSGNARIDKMFEVYRNIAAETLEDLRKYHLPEHNPFIIKNLQNYILKNNKNALEIVRDSTQENALRIFALETICASKKEKDIKKALETIDYFDPPSAQKILLACADLKITLESSLIAKICAVAAFNKQDYIALAKSFKEKLPPDEWLTYFLRLARSNENAHIAYVFVLLDLEMIDKAIEELKGFDKNEALGARAYIELKKAGKGYPIEAFVL